VVKIIDYFKLYDFEIYYQKSLAIVRFLSVALVWLSVLKYIDIDFQKIISLRYRSGMAEKGLFPPCCLAK